MAISYSQLANAYMNVVGVFTYGSESGCYSVAIMRKCYEDSKLSGYCQLETLGTGYFGNRSVAEDEAKRWAKELGMVFENVYEYQQIALPPYEFPTNKAMARPVAERKAPAYET